MLLQIITHTPAWVFVVFALLLGLGIQHLFARRVSLKRMTIMPVVMAIFSLYGVFSAFAATPLALAGWVAAAVATILLVLARALPASTRYDAASRSFHVGGSAVPLVLMMGIFFTKYVVGVQLAMHPERATHLNFALAVAVLYGAFAGIFMGRALRLWKLAMRQQPHIGGQTA